MILHAYTFSKNIRLFFRRRMQGGNDYQEIFDFALMVAKEAGVMIKEAYYKEKAITFKDTVDLVTETVFISKLCYLLFILLIPIILTLKSLSSSFKFFFFLFLFVNYFDYCNNSNT